jgi:hypothetical protein
MMRVIIANFGRQNYLWPDCLNRSVVSTFADEDLYPLWQAGDKQSYIDACLTKKTTAAGHIPTRSVAARWFNLGNIVARTENDLWIHREKDEIWWTLSLPGEVTTTLEAAFNPGTNSARVFVLRKPAEKWRSSDRQGRRLHWNALHAKARTFLFTESTFQALSPDYAEYAHALLNGDPLDGWHRREEWTKREGVARRSAVRVFSRREVAAREMAQAAFKTVKYADGQLELRSRKEKNTTFKDEHDLAAYVLELIEEQDGLCALTGIPLQFRGEHDDDQLLCSLDRIRSDGHYDRGNLQVVCKFVNRWKSDMPNDEFQRLLKLVQDAWTG